MSVWDVLSIFRRTMSAFSSHTPDLMKFVELSLRGEAKYRARVFLLFCSMCGMLLYYCFDVHVFVLVLTYPSSHFSGRAGGLKGSIHSLRRYEIRIFIMFFLHSRKWRLRRYCRYIQEGRSFSAPGCSSNPPDKEGKMFGSLAVPLRIQAHSFFFFLVVTIKISNDNRQ